MNCCIHILGLLGLILVPACQSGSRIIRITTGQAQLFVDDHLIESQVNVHRTLHQPDKDNGGNTPLVAARPGTTLLAYGTIVRDTRLNQYVMFVQEWPSRQMYRLTSADGLTWQAKTYADLTPVQIDLALPPLPPEVRGQPGIDLFSCYYDTHDNRWPYKGWVWMANVGNTWEGIWYIRSADGLAWEKVRQVFSGFAGEGDPSCQTITRDGRTLYGPGDVTLFYHDAVANRFLGLFKFYSPRALAPDYHSRCRAYAFLDRIDQPFDIRTLDRVALLPAMAERGGDRPCDEYYASTAWRYGSLWLGGLKVFHARDDYPYSSAGCAFLKLVVSRDGLHWNKVALTNDAGVPEVFIRNGREGGDDGRNDGGYISEFSQGPLRVNDELIYYYCSSSYGKNAPANRRITGGGIFRSRLRLDGFVSVDEGTLTTRPLVFDGDNLSVNGVGPIRVEVLDLAGRPLGDTLIEGDSLRHTVGFQGQSLRQALPTGKGRLRFKVEPPGRLYSFAIH